MKTILPFTCRVILLLVFLPFTSTAYTTSDEGGNRPAFDDCGFETNSYPVFAEAIRGFTLVDAITDQDLHVMKEGAIIDVALLGITKFNIRANEVEGAGGGVWADFALSGPVNRSWTERVAPFALFGDNNGNYNGVQLPQGNYHLMAVSTFQWESQLNTIEINFTLGTDTNAVIRFSLLNAQFNSDTSEFTREYDIRHGQLFDANSHPFAVGINPSEVSIRAHTNSFLTGSIVFSLSGPLTITRTENQEPYTLFGDSNGIFEGVVFPNGTYILTATPYRGKNGKGTQGIPGIVQFTIEDLPEISLQEFIAVVDTDIVDTRTVAKNSTNTFKHYVDQAVVVFPNPAVSGASIQTGPGLRVLRTSVFDFSGWKVLELQGDGNSLLTLDVSGLRKGTCFIHLETGRGMVAKKLLVN